MLVGGTEVCGPQSVNPSEQPNRNALMGFSLSYRFIDLIEHMCTQTLTPLTRVQVQSHIQTYHKLVDTGTRTPTYNCMRAHTQTVLRVHTLLE